MAKDPVCGMDVDESTELKLVHGGKTYHFCAPGCQKAFTQDPEKYLPGSPQCLPSDGHHGPGHHGCHCGH